MKKVLCIAMIASLILMGGCTSKKAKRAAELAKEGWGAESGGLIMKVTGPSSVEIDGPFEINLNIQNIDEKPIRTMAHQTLTIAEGTGRSIQWQGQAAPSQVTTINPNETYTITKRLDREGSFTPAIQKDISLSISVTCESDKVAEDGRDMVWSGKLVAPPVMVSVRDNNWGTAVNGLRAYVMDVSETVNVAEPMLIKVVVENSDTKPALLRASPDNPKKPQLDVEIVAMDEKTVFKTQRPKSDSVNFVTLSPGERVYTIVIPCDADNIKQIDPLAKQIACQKAMAADKKMKLAAIPPSRYSLVVTYSHLTEKGKTYPKNWKQGWNGALKSNYVATNLIGGTLTPPTPPPTAAGVSSYVEIKPTKGKAKTYKTTKTVAGMKKALAELKPLKKPTKDKVKGVIIVYTDSVPATYEYSSSYLKVEGDDTQYRIPEAIKNNLPK